ncbi:hypothetical protein [Saccharomonospora halophila]|uniref:hypothetical protein n=1 Tax=Saccharomonospora halophila TaxID=129922 RepID=UPI0012F8C770|nr:hypothetical protein [Saccharomonospora halophila]
MTTNDVLSFLNELDADVRKELDATPKVEDKDQIDVATLPIEARRWHRLSDVVAVVADLKGSTKLGVRKYPSSTASIYEASTGRVVKIFNSFDADFIAIQGDGAFALFWGELRYERATCAGITIKTFSESLVSRLEKRWPSLPETGFKVGIAASQVLTKRLGTPRNPAEQEPVWAGKAVNYAAKAAQSTERHLMMVTATIWEKLHNNDYIRYSCSCENGPSDTIWYEDTIESLPDGDTDSKGHVLKSSWCVNHGSEYCEYILKGKRKRSDVEHLRKNSPNSGMRAAIESKEERERRDQRARRRGL